MFTGIISYIGNISQKKKLKNQLIISVKNWDFYPYIKIGNSISINGVCLTVIEKKNNNLTFDLSQETISSTTLWNLDINALVNIERSVGINNPFEGHYVTGHIDSIASIIDITKKKYSFSVSICVNKNIDKYIVKKCSVAVDGVSLTVNQIKNRIFEISIIPYTWHHTIFYSYKIGNTVNIEIDIIARYIEKLIQF